MTEDASFRTRARHRGRSGVAAWGSLIPSHTEVAEAFTAAKPFLDDCPVAMEAIQLTESLAGDTSGGEAIVKHYRDMSAVHTEQPYARRLGDADIPMISTQLLAKCDTELDTG